MVQKSLEKFKTICSRIIREMPSKYTWNWTWDEEFSTALVVFDKDDSSPILSIVTKEFNHQWDFFNIDDSDEHIKAFFENAFGLIPGQKIYACEEDSGMMLFAAWWPWGNGEKVSLRIGIFSPEEYAFSGDESWEHLTTWFAI